jgi:hypothetical protein
MQNRKRYNPAKFNPARGGHAQGHLRNAFHCLVGFLEEHNTSELRPDTPLAEGEAENPYTPREIIGLLWNCTDVLPGHSYDVLRTAGLDFDRGTYGAASRALKKLMDEQEQA